MKPFSGSVAVIMCTEKAMRRTVNSGHADCRLPELVYRVKTRDACSMMCSSWAHTSPTHSKNGVDNHLSKTLISPLVEMYSPLYSQSIYNKTRGVTMHRCIDASRYMAPRYAYRIATQISRYFRRYNMRLNRDISAHVSRYKCQYIAIHKSTIKQC